MPLDKAIASGKEHRKPFYGPKAIDKTCRNHGSCPYCYGNRTYCNKKRQESAEDKMKCFKDVLETYLERSE